MNPNVHTAEVLPPRAMLFLGIVALHIVFAYLLTKGLMPNIIKVLDPTTTIDIFNPEPPRPRERPTIDPKMVDPTPVPLPPPEISLDPPDEQVFSHTVVEPETGPIVVPPETLVVPPQPPIRLVGRNVLPNTENYYPASKRRLGEEGSVVVRACVNETGKLEGAPVVEASSGTAQFDDAAVRVARDGRYARSMRGDTPVPNCHRFRVTFSMN